MNKLSLFFFIASIVNAACESASKKPIVIKDDAIVTAVILDPRISSTDSMVVVFYKDPFGTDSIRYTRYYTQVSLTDDSSLQRFQGQMKQPFVQEEKRKDCRGEGKIWCFNKGKIFQTVYFSRQCDTCCFTYILKDGNFYYAKAAEDFLAWLSYLKPMAKELENGGEEAGQ